MKLSFFIYLVFSVTFFSCSNLGNKTHDPDIERRISSLNDELAQLGQTTWENLSVQRQNELITVRTNLVKYLLHAAYKSEDEKLLITKKAEEYLESNIAKVLFNIKKEKLNQTSGLKKIHSPPSWTLASEVEWLNENTIDLPSGSRIGFDQLYRAMGHIDMSEMNGTGLFNNQISTEINNFATVANTTNNERGVSLYIVGRFEDRLDEYFSKIKKLGTTLNSTGELNLGNPEAEKFLVKFLDYYYSNVDSEVIKDIMNDIVVLGHEPEKMEMVGIMLKNSGPGLGKTLQQLGKEPTVGETIQEILEVLEDDGKAVPYHLVQRAVEKDKGGFKLTHISKKPLGTGTMAQVNKAKLKVGNKRVDVALRFLKPGIEKRAGSDIHLLNSFIEEMAETGEISEDFLPTARKLIESIASFLNAELSIPDAIDKQIYAKQVYEKKLPVTVNKKKVNIDIRVPSVYMPDDGKITNLHVQEFIEFGKKFSAIESQFSRNAIAKGITKVWFGEGLLKSGFIHSDLHQGNFTVNKVTEKEIKVTLFDFGMTEFLTEKTKKSFIFIGAGSEFKNAKLIADGFSVGRKVTKKNKKILIEAIENKMDDMDRPEDWIIWGLREGHLENEQLGTFARGGSLVGQLGKLSQDSDLAEEVIEDLLKEGATSNYFKLKYDFPLSRSELLKIGSASTKHSCFTFIKSFFGKK